ncbi:MAG: MurT ligase domain-containing protein [Clostridia bacterium]
MKNFFIILAMKILNLILKICHKNGGNFLGKIAFDWNPEIFKYFKVKCPVIAVSATNGKTMTNNCIGYTLKTAGYKVVSNVEGNNMETGILSTILKNCTLTGKIKADYLVFEVDESYIPVVFKDFRLDTLVILNFFRDQLDRNGEVESLILRINEFLKTYNGNLVLNNDDPNVTRLGQANPSNQNVYYFSVDKYQFATEEIKEAGEGKFCPFCKTRLEYEYYQYSHVGKFKCPNCNFGDNEIYKLATNVDLKNRCFDIDGNTYKINGNSIYLIYNYTAVYSVCSLYNISNDVVKKSFSTFALNNGRLEEIKINGVPTIINLAKNPTGSNVSLRILNEDDSEKDLLFVLNDNIADGFDVSWIWDINFNNLNNVSRIVTSGTRAYDIAIRIKTSGFPVEKIEPYLNLEDAIKALYRTSVKKYVIANYTSLQPTRHELKKFDEICQNNLENVCNDNISSDLNVSEMSQQKNYKTNSDNSDCLKILYLYPDMLELYGDYGNIQVLKYRIESRGYKAIIDRYSIGDAAPNFNDYDIVFAGGGADNEQSILANDLIKYKDNIKEAVNNGVFFLLICGAYQLFGKYYKGVEGNIIPGLEVFDYYTVANPDRKKRCIGNIVIDANLSSSNDIIKTKVIGFENHGGQTFDISASFGNVLFGNGNKFGDSEEGFFQNNVIATYLHGPLLSKNPELCDYIIKYCLDRRYNENVILEPLNDEFENLCREQLLKRFLEK